MTESIICHISDGNYKGKGPCIFRNRDCVYYDGTRYTSIAKVANMLNCSFTFKFNGIEKSMGDLVHDFPELSKLGYENKIRVVREMMMGYFIQENELLQSEALEKHLPAIIRTVRIIKYDIITGLYLVPKRCLTKSGYSEPNVFVAVFMLFTWQDPFCARVNYKTLCENMKLSL